MTKHSPCRCGSGLAHFSVEDAAGIFLMYACDQCIDRRLASYNPTILDPQSAYAASGDERDIGHYPYDEDSE